MWDLSLKTLFLIASDVDWVLIMCQAPSNHFDVAFLVWFSQQACGQILLISTFYRWGKLEILSNFPKAIRQVSMGARVYPFYCSPMLPCVPPKSPRDLEPVWGQQGDSTNPTAKLDWTCFFVCCFSLFCFADGGVGVSLYAAEPTNETRWYLHVHVLLLLPGHQHSVSPCRGEGVARELGLCTFTDSYDVSLLACMEMEFLPCLISLTFVSLLV